MAGIDELSALNGRATSELIADQLREHILRGAFPPGAQMIEAQLAARLEVSRGPVREALQRLSQEGLLVSRRNRGVFVPELTATDIAEVYWARKAVETAAAEAMLTFGTVPVEQTAQRLREIVDRMSSVVADTSWSRVAEVDMAFHSTFVDGSGNSRLSRINATLAAESRICMVNLKSAYRRPDSLVDEHQRIVDLLVAGDRDELCREIGRHMDKAVDDLTASMDQSIS